MSQNGFTNTGGPGLTFRGRVYAAFQDVWSSFMGSSRPTVITKGGIWAKAVDANTVVYYSYDGSQDVLLGTVNPTAHTWTPAAPQANVVMAGYKHTGAGSATENGQYIVYGQSADAVLTGDLGIGVTSVPANTKVLIDRLGGSTIPALTAGTVLTLAGSSSSSSPALMQMVSGNASVDEIRFGDTDATDVSVIRCDHSDSSLRFLFSGVERFGFGGGAFLIGTGSALSPSSTTNEGFSFGVGGAAIFSRAANPSFFLQRTTSDGSVALFYRQTTNVGSISVTASATAYNTSSDYRLKTEIEPMDGAIERLMRLNPGRFKWLVNLDGPYVDGFLAHEVAEVVPEAITGLKDAVEDIGTATLGDSVSENIPENEAPEGSVWVKTGTRPVYQGIDQSKLVPLLAASLQEAVALIKDLQDRVAVLESAA